MTLDSLARRATARKIVQWAATAPLPRRLVSVHLGGLAGALPLSVVVHLGHPEDRDEAVRALPDDVEWGEAWEPRLPGPVWRTLASTTGDAVPQTAAAHATAWGGVPVVLLSPATPEERS